MPKGQQRSNREPKKPKQVKKPVVPVSPFAATRPGMVTRVPGRKA